MGGGDGIAGGSGVGGVTVENSDAEPLVTVGTEVLEQTGAVHALETGTVYPGVDLGNGHGFHCTGENMDVFRPDFIQPGGIGAAEIVVARSDEDGDGGFLQGGTKGVQTLTGVRTVEDVTTEEHHFTALPAADFCHFAGNLQKRLAEGFTLGWGAAGEGGI